MESDLTLYLSMNVKFVLAPTNPSTFLQELYMGCLEKHWTKQREVIDNMYRDLRLPFDDIVR